MGLTGGAPWEQYRSTPELLRHVDFHHDNVLYKDKLKLTDLPFFQMVTRTKKIFVGGLSASTVQADLNAYFSTFGKVEEAMLMFDRQEPWL